LYMPPFCIVSPSIDKGKRKCKTKSISVISDEIKKKL